MMRPCTAILSFSGSLALLCPLALWLKERFFSSIPVMDGATSWFWIAQPLLLTVFFFSSATTVRHKILCYACIIAASSFLAFSAAEVYFRLLNIKFVNREDRSHDSLYVKSGQTTHLFLKDGTCPDPVLGYGATPKKMRLAECAVKGDKVLYDVLYSTDEDGRRITPDSGDNADTAVLLFGCSFTFGLGIHDQETYAWQLGTRLGKRFQVFNYGFCGYGSHQMLALIESGRLDVLLRRYKRIYAFYLTIADHEMRCVGHWMIDVVLPGPRYILKNGALQYAGMLNENQERDKLFCGSQIIYRLMKEYHRHWAPYSALDIHAAIIAKSMQELTARYHAHALTVIWPDFTRIEPILRDHGVRILSLTGVMPDFTAAPHGKYTIEDDGHPNAWANTLIAEALSEYILKHPLVAGER